MVNRKISMTTPRVTVPVEDLAGKLKAIRDKFLMPTPDKDFTDYAIMTRCVEALSAAPAPEGGAARCGVYVASRASAPERPAMWRKLRDHGRPIISTWIDEAGEGESHDLGDLWERILREVTSAERLVLYAEAEDFPLKGAYVEVGMALATGVPVFVVTPGVSLDARSLRPLGSWAKHPLVTFCGTVDDAFSALATREEAPAEAGEDASFAVVVAAVSTVRWALERGADLRDYKEPLEQALDAALRAQPPAHEGDQ